MYLAHRIAEIARWQGGHVTTKQLACAGLVSRMAVQHRTTLGQLIRVYHGVYAVGHLPTTPQDRAHGALLAAGARSALASRTALAFWRNDRDWPERLELISPLDRRVAGLIIAEGSTLLKRDIRTVHGLRVTSPARTALDLAAQVAKHRVTEHELTRLVNDLRHTNKLKVHQLRDVAQRNPRHHPGAKPLLRLNRRGATRTHALGTRERLPEAMQASPAPGSECQHPRRWGTRRRLLPRPRADRRARRP